MSPVGHACCRVCWVWNMEKGSEQDALAQLAHGCAGCSTNLHLPCKTRPGHACSHAPQCRFTGTLDRDQRKLAFAIARSYRPAFQCELGNCTGTEHLAQHAFGVSFAGCRSLCKFESEISMVYILFYWSASRCPTAWQLSRCAACWRQRGQCRQAALHTCGRPPAASLLPGQPRRRGAFSSVAQQRARPQQRQSRIACWQ